MIEKLTQEQIDKFPQYVSKWTKWAIEQKDVDIEKNIGIIYDDLGISRPRVIIAKGIKDFAKQFLKWHKDSQVRSQVWSQVRLQVRSQVRSQVESQVESQVRLQVRSQVRSQVESQVESQVRSQVESQVRLQVRSQVESQVRSQVESQVISLGYYRADDNSYNDFFISEGLVNCPKEAEMFYKYTELISGIAYMYVTEDVVVVLPNCKVRSNGISPHSDEFPALEYTEDEYYYLNGVLFDKKLWTKVVNRKMSLKEVMKIDDIDQRTQAMKYVDVDELIKEFDGKVLSEYQKQTLDGVEVNYRLVMIPKNDKLFDIDSYHAVYNCPSTGKIYMSGIDPELGKKGDIKECMAWKGKMTVDEWLRLIPLVSES